MRNILFSLWLLFTGLALMAQDNSYDFQEFRCGMIENRPIFESGYDSEYFLPLNDSTFISLPGRKTFSLSKEDLLDEFIWDFNHKYYTDFGTYLVHSGGGVVLHYDGVSLSRIDDSFYHQNQYGGHSFAYKNDLYLFAGHGLFTSKNILTKYDRELREWMLVNQTGKIPDFNLNGISVVIKDKLYLLTAQTKEGDPHSLPALVYALDLKQMDWQLLGQIEQELTDSLGFNWKKIFIDSNNKNLIIKGDKGIYLIDFINNSYVPINFKYPLKSSAFMNYNKGQDIMAFYCDNKAQLEHQVINKESFYANMQSPKILYEGNLDLYYSVIIKFFITGLILTLVLLLLREFKMDSRIVIRLRNGSFIYKARRIKAFDLYETRFLVHLAESGQFTYQDLENMISNDNDSAVTRTKNREKFIRILSGKLSTIFNISSHENLEILSIRSNEQDKRLKYYILNLDYFKVM